MKYHKSTNFKDLILFIKYIIVNNINIKYIIKDRKYVKTIKYKELYILYEFNKFKKIIFLYELNISLTKDYNIHIFPFIYKWIKHLRKWIFNKWT